MDMIVDSETLHSQILQPPFTLSPPLPLVAESPLLAFNKFMNKWSSQRFLSQRIDRAGNDPEEQEEVFADILCAATEKLGLPIILLRDAKKLIKDLDDDKWKGLQEGMKAGVEKHDWARLIEHPILGARAPIPAYDPEWILAPELSKQATMKSWSHPYQGDTADLFYRYMEDLDHSALYARLLPLIQSSGMGKSRLVDEFSKKYFVIPFNLREGNHGCPAPDTSVYDWLTRRGLSSQENDNRFSAFLTALFEEVYKVIKDPRAGILDRIRGCADLSDADKAAALRDYPDSLPGQFRLFMTIGQTFERQGPLRINFYNSVLREADELYGNFNLSEVPPNEKSPSGKFKKRSSSKSDEVVKLKKVIELIWKTFKSASSPRRIVLAFDEAHTLFPHGQRVQPFTSLRRALRGMREHPIWSVFLSTTDKSSQFATPPHDPSDRVLWGQLSNAIPFTLLGFDQVAKKFEGTLKLGDVTELSFRYSLGRPLWLTRYENGCPRVRDTMVQFAIQKLLFASQGDEIFGDTKREFAIMSRRLALDFDMTACDGKEKQEAERNQMTQVERHMRVCLGVKEDSAVTVAASEPILSEAAAIVMQRPGFRSCRSLRNILQWPGMSKGDRGELISCNISIDTLDSVMFEDRQLKSLSVEVTSYFQALFASDIYTKKIQSMLPSKLADEGRKHTFAATFANSRIYVTHFIKVYDYKVLSVEFLAKCATRGVAIVCADNQLVVNVIIPIVTDKDKPLTKDNITAILIQSKNDVRCSTKVFSSLFHAMDPYGLGIFDKSTENPPPVIRMVYALASRKSGVCVVKSPQRKNPPTVAKQEAVPKKKKYAYTSFDIWCAQASSSTFRTIRTDEDGVYAELLKLSRDVPKMFRPSQEYLTTNAMSMYPCGSSGTGHWQFCVPQDEDQEMSDKEGEESDEEDEESDEE